MPLSAPKIFQFDLERIGIGIQAVVGRTIRRFRFLPRKGNFSTKLASFIRRGFMHKVCCPGCAGLVSESGVTKAPEQYSHMSERKQKNNKTKQLHGSISKALSRIAGKFTPSQRPLLIPEVDTSAYAQRLNRQQSVTCFRNVKCFEQT